MGRRKLKIDPRARLPVSTNTTIAHGSLNSATLDHEMTISRSEILLQVQQQFEIDPNNVVAVDRNYNNHLINLPSELIVRICSFLRANCLARFQQTCKSFNSSILVHSIVANAAEFVYPPEMTSGFELQPVGSLGAIVDKNRKNDQNDVYTFEHLRNMELLVIARVLSSPEPTVGFVVSRSWCKTALKWLEVQQECRDEFTNHGKKKGKGAKKVQRSRQRQSSENITLCPNINGDIICPHSQLQHLSNNKSARARRRLLDRKAWNVLKALYPESTPLESVYGECVQCRADAETVKKNQADEKENEKLLRKLPLSNPALRRLYTRTRGVPEHCLRITVANDVTGKLKEKSDNDKEDSKPSATTSKGATGQVDFKRLTSTCPLVSGTYYVLPRSWCHGWRRYMKTGEGGLANVYQGYSCNRNSCAFPPPDAAVLLCDFHNMALLPPHLESYLFDDFDISIEHKQLLRPITIGELIVSPPSPAISTFAAATISSPPSVHIVGQGPTDESIEALRSTGMTDDEVGFQLSAMRVLEESRRRDLAIVQDVADDEEQPSQRPRSGSLSNNELLDRENHVVVEILDEEEFVALESCWPGTTVFALPFVVTDESKGIPLVYRDAMVHFHTPVCRECDTTGRNCSFAIKNRARNWIRKSSDKARAPASLEY
jgi:hypothetical protein